MAEIDRRSFPDRTLPANAEADPSAFSFSDEEIERVLRRGPNTEGSTLRIAMQYESHPTPREAQAFLKAEYGISGHSVTFLDGSSGFVAFSGQGMLLSRHGFSQEMRLRWPAVEQIVRRMIERDDYLGEMERLQLSEMKRILAEENLPGSTPRAMEDPPGEDTAESFAPEAADTPALDFAELASSHDSTVEENAAEQGEDSSIDDALREWNGDAASKQAVVRYMKDHADDPGTAEWLKQEYGDDLPAFPVTSPAVSTDLPWSTVQRRIALLIREDRFYTEAERDALDDIDADAIREHLERGDASAADKMLEAAQTAYTQADEPMHERFTVIETEGGFAVWDDVREAVYADEGAAPRTFPSEAQAEAYRQQVRQQVEDQTSRDWMYVERARNSEEQPKQEYVYAVGDTVYLDNNPFEIEQIGSFDVHLRDLNAVYPISRAESRQNFEAMLWSDARNARYLPGNAQTVIPTNNREITVSPEEAAMLETQLAQAGIGTARFVHEDGSVTFSFNAFDQEAVEALANHLHDAAIPQAEPDTRPEPEISEETVAYYAGEKNGLPYDVVVQELHVDEPEHDLPVPEPAGNFHIQDDHLGEGGPKEKFWRNIKAIATLKQIESEGRPATLEEQHILSQYVGWGGLPEAFDDSRPAWASEYDELKGLLTPEEYASARASTLNAHYTSPTVIKAIYEAVGNMGFRTGNILEPSCGVGNFFGLLPERMAASRLYGVELDSVTGRIARLLYPQADITVAGFETTDRKDFFDLAVGNVPFGAYQVPDRPFDRYHFLIHDYFIAKALDQVRPGGVIAFVTSKGTMDKQNSEVRRYIAQRAELLGAIRLPNTAFKANAGTEVTSDILFLQKRDRAIDVEPDWVHLGQTEDSIPVNAYFADHPDMILGRMVWDDSMYGAQQETACHPIPGAELSEQLAAVIPNIHGQYAEVEPPELADSDSTQITIPADPNVRNYSYTVVDDRVYYRDHSVMTAPRLSAAAEARIKGMVALRDCVHRLMDAQLQDAGDDRIHAMQAELNALYDRFTTQYGLINSRPNAQAFSDDSSYYLLSSLEILDENGQLERKADMFTKRTIRQQRTVEHADTAVEALAVSIAEKAAVDLPFMARLTGKSEEEIASDLTGVIFRLPPSDDGADHPTYVTADEYLSGQVRQKLREARAAAEKSPLFAINVQALEKVQPPDLDASEIDVRLGATWVDKEYIQQFMEELFEIPLYQRRGVRVQYSALTSEWRIQGKGNLSYNNVANNMTYGTDRANGLRILEDTLNLRDIRIYDIVEDADGKEKRVLNQKATTLAQQKQQAIKDAFRDWIWRDPERREVLTRKYNELFNGIRPREYDGSHITFSGMNPEITLREHQRNAIAHTLYGGNTLLAHVVGAGKTYEMVASAMESKRLGLCSKSMFVVPNHLTEQWASEFLRLYPAAHILVTTRKDFEKNNRRRFCSRIATGDYDAVIIGHSQFEKIPMSRERRERLLQEQIDEVTQGIQELKVMRGEPFSIKQMERTKKQLESRLRKLQAEERKDDVVTFEELGIDRLFVDEAHAYKNLFLTTKMRNVAGLSTSEAQKSTDMYLKCRYMDEITGGRGVIFATGTPISNSMTEMYTMQRYLQNKTLREMGLSHFDAWASTFGETTTAIELAPEGYNF